MRPLVDTCANSCKPALLLLVLLSALLSHSFTTPSLEAVAMCNGRPAPSAAAYNKEHQAAELISTLHKAFWQARFASSHSGVHYVYQGLLPGSVSSCTHQKPEPQQAGI
jgi:hypothetical protein